MLLFFSLSLDVYHRCRGYRLSAVMPPLLPLSLLLPFTIAGRCLIIYLFWPLANERLSLSLCVTTFYTLACNNHCDAWPVLSLRACFCVIRSFIDTIYCQIVFISANPYKFFSQHPIPIEIFLWALSSVRDRVYSPKELQINEEKHYEIAKWQQNWIMLQAS